MYLRGRDDLVRLPSNDAQPAAPALAEAPIELVPPPSAVRRYEELEGGEGRGVFFRPHRYTAADLAPLSGTVSLAIGGVRHACPVHDVSQNGVAFTPPPGAELALRQRLAISLRFDGHEAFRGDVHVGSIRAQDGATLVGVSFHDFMLDVDELLQLRSVVAWRAAHATRRVQEKPWHVPGAERYTSLVAELRLYLEDAERQLGDLEAQLPWHVLHGPENAARSALVSQLRADFVADAVRLSEEIDAAVRQLPDGHANPLAREWSRRHVHRYLMESPGCHRALAKPFGYPGDYEVMNFIYERWFEGTTLFARAVQLAFASTRACVAVRARKDLVKRQLQALLERRAGGTEPVRVLSIAAGPAQELVELFEDLDELPVPVEVVLFEQDKGALAHAWRRLSASVQARFPREVRLTFLHDSIKRLLRDADVFAPFGRFDLVYSCGLFDYLQQRTAVTLARRLGATLAPEGRLLVANMVDHATRWLMEVHLDWPLVYRTRDELLEVGTRAMPGAASRILEEESGANPFVEVVRR